jgi:hypothetical protein
METGTAGSGETETQALQRANLRAVETGRQAQYNDYERRLEHSRQEDMQVLQ